MMTGELRVVPATLVPALESRTTRQTVAAAVIASRGLAIERAWPGLEAALAGLGADDALAGRPLYGVDTGHGPPELCRPDEVSARALALAAIDERGLRAAPGVDRGELIAAFRKVRGFYAHAAHRGRAVVVFLRGPAR